MGSISKSFSLLLIVLILAMSSLIMAKPAFAQTPTPTPTPPVPEFTVQLVGPPYTVPTTYSLNQSSGQIVAQIGYTNEYSNIVVTIKNQANTSNYNIQIKDHNANINWGDLYTTEGGGTYPMQSPDSNYTSISISIEEVGLAGMQIDIQVQAMDGYVYNADPYSLYGNYTFSGETSAWSPTQTVTIPANVPLSPTPSPSTLTPTPTATPTATPKSTLTSVSSEFNSSLLLITTIALVVIAFLLAIIIFLLLYMRKRRITLSQTNITPTHLKLAQSNSPKKPLFYFGFEFGVKC